MRNEPARLALALSPVLLWLLALIIVERSPLGFVLLMIGGAVLLVTLALVFRCPNCGKSLYQRERQEGPFRTYSVPTFERTCSRCGERQLP